jgi:hypothetical protein
MGRLIPGGSSALVSRRPIRAGAELTIDYSFSPNAAKVACRCGAPLCRGTINISRAEHQQWRREQWRRERRRRERRRRAKALRRSA